MVIQIDGAHGEGGGQIVRTAMALSVLTGRAFEIHSIRSGRAKPGLKAQHLTALHALKQIAGVSTNPVKIGSQHLRFTPGVVQAGQYAIDIGTAGSISLLLQALLLPLLFAKETVQLDIKGGTCGKWQTPYDYMKQVLLPYLSPFGTIRMDLLKHGYYPKGGGHVTVRIDPLYRHWKDCKSLPPFQLEGVPTLQKIEGISHASSALEPARVAERQAREAEQILRNLGCPVHVGYHYHETFSPGSQINLWAIHQLPEHQLEVRLGANALGKKGKPAEAVAGAAVELLMKELSAKAPVDEFLADQLVPFLALCPGSIMEVPFRSEHLLSNIHVTEKFLPVRFEWFEKRKVRVVSAQ